MSNNNFNKIDLANAQLGVAEEKTVNDALLQIEHRRKLLESLQKGFNFLRTNIIKFNPTFFDPLGDQEYGGTGWDLMWGLMEDGFKYRAIPEDKRKGWRYNQ